jgi:Fur family ferric uptake transcriptional regulator
VTKHQFGTNYAQFEKSTLIRQHDHFIFIDSGDVLEFYDPRIEEIRKYVEDQFKVDILSYSLTFYGNSKPKK